MDTRGEPLILEPWPRNTAVAIEGFRKGRVKVFQGRKLVHF